ncbi:MAG: SDR family NAD(P)-dependent oxidoreductase [Casimicrobium sp.]
MKQRKLRLLIVGAGDVARRLTTRIGLADRARWLGIARSSDTAIALRQHGILPVDGDLDFLPSLKRAGAMARSAAAVLHLAPPPGDGKDDPRMKRWLAAASMPSKFGKHRRAGASNEPASGRSKPLSKPKRTPLRNVYVSTTGVYGDCVGERINETRRASPTNARAKRRVAAEARVRATRGARFTILRAPGIYAAERLPVERLRAGTPALIPDEDVFTNHIHGDDLARAVWLAVFRGGANRVLNVVDDGEQKMGDYFDRVAGAVGLPRPPRLPRALLIREVSPMLYSFMSESRRIENQRMKRELRLRLAYPTPATLLAKLKPAAALQRPLL